MVTEGRKKGLGLAGWFVVDCECNDIDFFPSQAVSRSSCLQNGFTGGGEVSRALLTYSLFVGGGMDGVGSWGEISNSVVHKKEMSL